MQHRGHKLNAIAEFNFTWMLVLWTGLIIFYKMLVHTAGEIALLVYLTVAIHHSIRSIPSFWAYFFPVEQNEFI